MTPLAKCLMPLAMMAIAGTVGQAAPVRTQHVESELISESASIQAGKPFTVGLRMKMDEHWHTYWVNPGGPGLATNIEWTLPEGFAAGPIQWPHPVRIPTPPLMTYGYEGEVLLMSQITPPPSLRPGSHFTIGATANWLVCEKVCIPGGAQYTLELPVSEGQAASDPKWQSLFAETRRQLPVEPGPDWFASFTITDDAYSLTVRAPNDVRMDASSLYFFPLDETGVEAAKPQQVEPIDGGVRIRMERSDSGTELPENLRGVLVADSGFPPALPDRAVLIRAAPGAVGAAAGVAGSESAEGGGGLGLGVVLALAFIGGLILNLMPCVFPVLGIKILGFVNQAGSDRRKVTLHGLVFTAGVLASFWILAGVLIVLRAGGQELGWGFQLQSPLFVFALAVFLLVFALNLSGLFEIGLSATGVGSSLQMKSGYGGSFFTGVLATVVATPCSAPFLAPALGAAISLPAVASLAVFTAIAIGLSTPYLVLSCFPDLIKFLPRPGAWMETFKQLMAFPLYATVGFLVWVLAGQVSETGLLKVYLGLVLVSMAAWAYGRWTQGGASGGRRVFGFAFAGVALVAGLSVGRPAGPSETAIVWEKWSPETVSRLQADSRLVYVDFTARWCATCQSNKALVFSSDEVRQTFKRLGVVPLKADWTNHNPEITQALSAYGRSAVPFNLIYAPGASEPIILPEILTPEIVLEALEKAAARQSAGLDQSRTRFAGTPVAFISI